MVRAQARTFYQCHDATIYEKNVRTQSRGIIGWSTVLDLEKRHIRDEAEGSCQRRIKYESFRAVHLTAITHSVRPYEPESQTSYILDMRPYRIQSLYQGALRQRLEHAHIQSTL